MKNLGPAVVNFANVVGVPWYLYTDHDNDGGQAVEKIFESFGRHDEHGNDRVVWNSASTAAGGSATERLMVEFDEALCRQTALAVRTFAAETSTMDLLKGCNGTIGGPLARAIIDRYPRHADWPPPILELIAVLGTALQPERSDGDEE